MAEVFDSLCHFDRARQFAGVDPHQRTIGGGAGGGANGHEHKELHGIPATYGWSPLHSRAPKATPPASAALSRYCGSGRLNGALEDERAGLLEESLIGLHRDAALCPAKRLVAYCTSASFQDTCEIGRMYDLLALESRGSKNHAGEAGGHSPGLRSCVGPAAASARRSPRRCRRRRCGRRATR